MDSSETSRSRGSGIVTRIQVLRIVSAIELDAIVWLLYVRALRPSLERHPGPVDLMLYLFRSFWMAWDEALRPLKDRRPRRPLGEGKSNVEE